MTDQLDGMDGESAVRAYETEAFGEANDPEDPEFLSLDELDEIGGSGDLEGPEAEGDALFEKHFRKIRGRLKRIRFPRALPLLAGRIAGGYIGGPLGSAAGSNMRDLYREEADGEHSASEAFEFEEFDFEDEIGEDEFESEAASEDDPESFGLDPYNDGLAEQLAGLAAETESEAEASALLGGVTIHIMSSAPMAVRRTTPTMVKSITRLGRFLRRRPGTRVMVKTIPTIQRHAVKLLSTRAGTGARITSPIVRKAMARAAFRTLRSPAAAARGLANNKVKRMRLARMNRKAAAHAER